MLTIGQLAGFFIEALGLRVANRRIERRDDAENAHAVSGRGEVDRLQRIVDGLKIGRLVAGF